MTGSDEKPASAWTPSQVVDFMLERLSAGDFYILCPDNTVDRATDERRMRWAMDDIILNRPALSRWHPAGGPAPHPRRRRRPAPSTPPAKLGAHTLDPPGEAGAHDPRAAGAAHRHRLGLAPRSTWPASAT